MYGEDSEIFRSEELPNPIRTIYFTNTTAWRRNANNTDPENRIEVFLDFGKPALFDPNPLVSDPTPNASGVTVRAHDMSYFMAAKQIVEVKLESHRTWYKAIHRSFAYDFGMWVVALPSALILATNYGNRWFPIGGELESYRWAFFIYSVGIVLIGYRFLTGYAKWAFPVNVLTNNKDNSLRHRIALGAIFSWLAYKAIDAIFGLLPFAN